MEKGPVIQSFRFIASRTTLGIWNDNVLQHKYQTTSCMFVQQITEIWLQIQFSSVIYNKDSLQSNPE